MKTYTSYLLDTTERTVTQVLESQAPDALEALRAAESALTAIGVIVRAPLVLEIRASEDVTFSFAARDGEVENFKVRLKSASGLIRRDVRAMGEG